ncbi:volume-regulated anion channel subunit LRRC8C-like isoform X2 [Ascaphus truei]|uniref:volume-regulated anion channel subunit LRRC8C-like isoform X2 n=1 Tax=Ascaphus truei TaxID=8439 RepID=UPI003F5AC1FD
MPKTLLLKLSYEKMLCVPMPPHPLIGTLLVNFTSLDVVQAHQFPSRYKMNLDLQYYLLAKQWCYDNAVQDYSRYFPYLILTNSMIFLIISNFWFKFPGTSSKIEHFISVLGKCLNSQWTIKALSETVYEDTENHLGKVSTSIIPSTPFLPSTSVLGNGEQKAELRLPLYEASQVHLEGATQDERPLLTSKSSKKFAGAVLDTGSTVKILDKKEGEQAKALFEKVKKFRLYTEEKDILHQMYKKQTILRTLEAVAFVSYVGIHTPRMKHVAYCVEPLNVTGYTKFYCIHGLWRMWSMLSFGYLFILSIYICICFYTLHWIFYYKLKEYSFETIRKESGIDDIPDVINDFAFLLHLIDQFDKLYSWKFAVFLSDVSETKLLQVNLNHYWSLEKLKQCLSINARGKTELRLCMLPGIPTQVFELVEIEVLRLEFIKSLTLIPVITNLRLLNELWVLNSRVKVETQALAFLKKNLDILRVCFTTHEEFPSWIYSLSQLQELYLGGRLQLENKSTITLQSFKELTQLKFLSLKLHISKIPSAIIDLAPILKSLTIHNDGSKLLSLISLQKFTNLIHLRLIHCQLGRIPSSIFSLVKLQEIDLSSNNLTSLMELTSFQQLKKLNSLRLSKNIISSIPPDISEVTNLEMLYLNGNKLSSLSPGVFKLTKLFHLDVSKNKISDLPPEIEQLEGLEYLSISHNQLTFLPDQLFSCTNIQTLVLSNNKISTLSPLVRGLTQLSLLDLMGNPLKKLPTELEMCPYLHRNQLLVEKEIFDTLPHDIRERMKNSGGTPPV